MEKETLPNPAMTKHREIMSSLTERHEVLLPLLRECPIHFLDIPMYGNVGDLLIMLGTLRFFEKNRLQITRYGMYFSYLAGWAKNGDVLVFQGGGNFGDIYGPFQAFREKLIAELPNNRILILPQTIHFSNPAKFKNCCKILSQHPDLHICVRDPLSAVMAKQMTPHVYFLPDMAHQLWPIECPVKPYKAVLQLQRRDNEAKCHMNSISNTFDWFDLVGPGWTFFLSQIAERSIYHATKLGVNKHFANIEARIWIVQAKRFVEQAVALFSRYKRVESDRLHAHILASLLSIPNRIGDNSYGKNGSYITAWTSSSDLVELVDNHALFSEHQPI